ncbi:MAG: hydantoinase/oxoprolinase family protein [bacterium]|jgi:N-methylhydantoinase A
MLVGIDVGGTFTDGVLYQDGKIIKAVKSQTRNDNLEKSILNVLDSLLQGRKGSDITRVALSTTLVTNILATGGGDKVALILIPGPGLNLRQLQFFPNSYIISGATDFRGRITEELDKTQVKKAGEQIARSGIQKVAVVGKFSQRNKCQECQVENILHEQYPQLQVIKGFDVSGQLNFLRRIVTTYYTAVTQEAWAKFATSIEKAIRARSINCTINILKADGGTMPLEVSRRHPCETIFSGPAASVMGAFALTMDQQTSIVIDIGGTTTDLALILAGKPLSAARGAVMGGHYSHVQSFATRSLALGGDSALRRTGKEVTIGPERLGPAACFGGPVATTTDAVNFLNGGKLGQLSLSSQALAKIARPAGLTIAALAQGVIEQVSDKLEAGIKDMFTSWEQEPAYKIWEIINRRKVKADRIVGIGAAAKAFVPILAKRLGCQVLINPYAPVANALGAAVSRPTLSLLVHADTQQRSYHLNLDSISSNCDPNLRLEDVKELARKHLQKIAAQRGIGQYSDLYTFFLEEQFNIIRGWSTLGKLYDVGIQIAPGVIDDFKGVQS